MARCKKAIKSIITLAFTAMSLSACGMNDVLDHATAELWQRARLNIEQIDRLRVAGIITDDSYNAMREGIISNLEAVGVTEEGASSSASGSSDDAEELLKSANFQDAIRYAQGDDITKAIDEVSYSKDDSELVPFELISLSDTELSELQDKLQYQVYVLKKHPEVSKDVDDPNTYMDLSELSSIISGAQSGSIEGTLDTYFVYSGRTILDMASEDNSILKASVSTEPLGAAVDFGDGYIGAQSQWYHWGDTEQDTRPAGNYNKLGVDLVLSKIDVITHEGAPNGYEISNTIAVQVNDFNKEMIDKVVGKEGASEQVYLISGQKAYLMEYPVWYIDGWSSSQEGETYKFSANYKMSDLKVNLISGKVMYKDGTELYNTTGQLRNWINNGGNSSFVLDGVSRFRKTPPAGETLTTVTYTTDDTTTSTIGGTDTGYYSDYICDYGCNVYGRDLQNNTALTQGVRDFATQSATQYNENLTSYGSIVLRDYLEYSYAPNVISGESAVAIGRMFRVSAFAGDGRTEIAKFIGKSGSQSNEFNSIAIQSSDLMDITKLSEGVKYKLDLGQSAGSASEGTSEGSTETTTASTTGGDPMGLTGITSDGLEVSYTTDIISSARFPSTSIGVADNANLQNATDNTKTKPIMYGMALDLDAYNSNLLSNWINVDGDGGDLGSLNWWNVWLSDSGYTYSIDKDMLLNSLQGNYNFDITGSDKIILNLNTLQGIQEIYDRQQESDSVGFIKTVFKVLGVILILYSALLMAAWIYDNNMVMGPRLLGMLTLGRWVAISSDVELPELNMENKKYINFSSMIVSCIFLIAIGVVLNVIGIVDIILFFIDQFAIIWETLYEMVLG